MSRNHFSWRSTIVNSSLLLHSYAVKVIYLRQSKVAPMCAAEFSPNFWCIVSQRLQLKNPDHFPDNLYDLKQIHEAAHYILHGTPSTVPAESTSHPTSANQSMPMHPEIKTEDVMVLISLLRLWTHNQPFFDFPRDLSPCHTTPHHTTPPYHAAA